MTDLPAALRWAVLVAASVALGWLMHHWQLPAALLLGPLVAAIGVALAGGGLALPRPAFIIAQGVLGCVIARAITASILVSIAHDWPAIVAVVATTILASAAVGWVLTRIGTLPGATAAWGSAPGAASAMVAMSDEFGADARLVAFMQYLRVVCVVATASLVTRFWFGGAVTAAVPADDSLAALAHDWPAITMTLAIAVGGAFAGVRSGLPAGGLLVPLAIGGALHVTETVDLTLPDPLLMAAYGAVGWFVGLRFTRDIVGHALRALPQLLVSTFALIALCSVSGLLLVTFMGVDPLTAFLATTPGGVDSIAIIALGGQADVALILAVQTLRLFVVIIAGPAIARLIARAAPNAPPPAAT